MNSGRCVSCNDPLGIASRADRRTCSDLCRKRVSLARHSEPAASRAPTARHAVITPPKGHRPTARHSREKRGSQP
jgi:hypothetical protein